MAVLFLNLVATSATARFIRQPSNLTVVEGSPEEIMQCHVENTKVHVLLILFICITFSWLSVFKYYQELQFLTL